MKGVNDLILCESSMMEALQFWLDAQFVLAAPKVTGVCGISSSSVNTFKIRLEEGTDAKG